MESSWELIDPGRYGCFQKSWFSLKMDGENSGSKSYEQMDDLGGKPPIFGNTHITLGILADPRDPG